MRRWPVPGSAESRDDGQVKGTRKYEPVSSRFSFVVRAFEI